MNRNLTLIIVGLVMMIQPVCAQSFDDYLEVAREVLHTEKKAAVAEAMILEMKRKADLSGNCTMNTTPNYTRFTRNV